MNKLTIPYKGRFYRFDFAGSWHEVPAHVLPWLGKHIWPMIDTYRELVEVSKANPPRDLELLLLDGRLQEHRIELLRRMCGVGRWPFSKKNKAFYSMLPDEVADVLATLNFIFKKIELQQPFAHFGFWGYRYYGPRPGLENLSGAEFHFAELVFAKALTGDAKALAELVAILYRPKGQGPKHNPESDDYCGDVRVPFNRFAVDARAKHFLALADKVKYPLLLWYAGQRARIMEGYPEVFSGSATEQAINEGWLPIFRALAKDPLNFDVVAEKPLTFILWELTKLHQEAEVQRRKLQQQQL
jgi:hypothetical protein